MSKIEVLTTLDIDVVTGGNGIPAPGIIQQLEEMFPGGDWVGNSFFPNGAPEAPWTGPVVTGA